MNLFQRVGDWCGFLIRQDYNKWSDSNLTCKVKAEHTFSSVLVLILSRVASKGKNFSENLKMYTDESLKLVRLSKNQTIRKKSSSN